MDPGRHMLDQVREPILEILKAKDYINALWIQNKYMTNWKTIILGDITRIMMKELRLLPPQMFLLVDGKS
jgi:hypothetical protein